MCGIAGIINFSGQTPSEDLLKLMTDVIEHRGPDGSAAYISVGIAFGHRRLSIIDLAGGHQPMTTSDDRVTITYNGEIYNFPELREELKALGYQFKTSSDTEVILQAYHAWGPKSVERIRGMFAYAIHDKQNNEVFIARDRLGIKPLFYAQLSGDTFVFGSELKSLKLHPNFNSSLRTESTEEYFALGYVPEPHTIYKNVMKLEPGHTLLINTMTGRIENNQYWNIEFNSDYKGSFNDASRELDARVEEAVRIRMRADVPLGAFLSGGVDSSAVVANMAKNSADPVNTCSIGFKQADFDESDYADQIAEQYKTSHKSKFVDPNDFSLVDKLMDYYDEPYADSSALPTFRVCELARENVTVALFGDGGDEHLAGYRRYKLQMFEQNLRSKIPSAIRKPIFGTLGSIYPKADWAPRIFRAKTTFQGIARSHVESYFHGVSILKPEMRQKLYSPKMKSDLQDYTALEVFNKHASETDTDDPLSMIQYLDIKTYLAGDILTKVDRASMAYSLEVRVPLLDHELVGWIATLPSSFKLNNGEGKYIFKKSLEKDLPHDILYRPKMGFRVPLKSWFRNELKEKIKSAVLSERMLDSGYFDQGYLTTLINEHQSGLRDHSAPLWTLMMYDQFLARHA
ncbi:XrtA/PEP-CTERM system amidotransferase [Pseudemcibacter sp.]|uniref:XrtA/PEP-CTERM system amidotransferase n=1 Tax=Pseudemcibacter sp. TaxID=2943293 RepID=UPI003F6A2727